MTNVADGTQFDFLKDGFSELRGLALVLDGPLNEIKLSAGGAIRGKVVDAAGKPVRNFNIRMGVPRHLQPTEPMGSAYAGYDWYGISYTRDDGVFVMTGLIAGCWHRLIISSPGIGVAVLNRVQAESLDQLSPPEDLTIELEPYVPLSVKVVDETSERPISNAACCAHQGPARFFARFQLGLRRSLDSATSTAKDGMAVFAEPACEDGTIIVRAPGYARTRLGVTSFNELCTVSLKPEASLTGEVRLNNQLLADGYVRLTSATNDAMAVALEETSGKFQFDQLPPGDYQLTVTNKRGQSLSTQSIKLEAGPNRAKQLLLRPARFQSKVCLDLL